MWINPFWEDDRDRSGRAHGSRPGDLRLRLAAHRGMPRPLDYVAELKEFTTAERRMILNDNVNQLIALRPT